MLPQAQDYLDFELNIEPLADDKMRVSLIESPFGSIAIEVATPFTPDQIKRVIGVLDGSISSTRGEAIRVGRAFGEKLFSAIFSGQIYAAYLASRGQAGENGLRIKLTLHESLEDWPWELLRDPASDYLVLSRQTPIIRFPRLLTIRPLVEVTLPLRVLVLISSPLDQEPLDVESEWRGLLEATADLRSRGLLHLERVNNAQLTTLQRELRQGTSYQIFHYIGHAAYDEQAQAGMLAFVDPRSELTQPVSGEALARELSEENSIRLVVLNACQGARANQKDPFAGIASSIVARGVPAVVAMQYAISDQASRVFSQEFYRTLCEGYPIEAATAEARRAISSTLANLEWVTPVLYLRAKSGLLFPKRSSIDTPVSTGGLREFILRWPILMLAAIVCIAAAGILAASIRPPTPTPGPDSQTPTLAIATLTPTPPGAASDIDLSVLSLRYTPSDPAPGQLVIISIRVTNLGTTDSGPFTWGWWATDPVENPTTPTLSGTINNRSPGGITSISQTYRFPWWGSPKTAVFVNEPPIVDERSIINNNIPRTVITSDRPFVVDFTGLPNIPEIDPSDIKGDDFAPWGFVMGVETTAQPNCANAVLRVVNGTDANGQRVSELTTTLPGAPDACANLPIVLTLDPPASDKQVASVSISFIPAATGAYSMELTDMNGTVMQRQVAQVAAASTTTPQTLKLTAPPGTFDQVRIVFRPPGKTIIRSISFALPETP